jgi:hypothetical protein
MWVLSRRKEKRPASYLRPHWSHPGNRHLSSISPKGESGTPEIPQMTSATFKRNQFYWSFHQKSTLNLGEFFFVQI